jgi:hypothetical protein
MSVGWASNEFEPQGRCELLWWKVPSDQSKDLLFGNPVPTLFYLRLLESGRRLMSSQSTSFMVAPLRPPSVNLALSFRPVQRLRLAFVSAP